MKIVGKKGTKNLVLDSRLEGCGEYKVYFIVDDSRKYTKIGYSKDIAARLKDLQTGCPLKLSIQAVLSFKTEAVARKVEKTAHTLCIKKYGKTQGEWFRLRNQSPMVIADMVMKCLKGYEEQILLKEARDYDDCNKNYSPTFICKGCLVESFHPLCTNCL